LEGARTTGLSFRSHVTGAAYYAGVIQQQILKPAGEKIGHPELVGTSSGTRIVPFWTKRALPSVLHAELMGTARGTTMNVYGNASLRAKQTANSKVVQMVMPQETTTGCAAAGGGLSYCGFCGFGIC